jgi:hypothetical protein
LATGMQSWGRSCNLCQGSRYGGKFRLRCLPDRYPSLKSNIGFRGRCLFYCCSQAQSGTANENRWSRWCVFVRPCRSAIWRTIRARKRRNGQF